MRTYTNYYAQFVGGATPAGLWRTVALDLLGSITAFVNNEGGFGTSGPAGIIGSVALTSGFTSADANPAFLFSGAPTAYINIPFMYVPCGVLASTVCACAWHILLSISRASALPPNVLLAHYYPDRVADLASAVQCT